MGTDWGKDNHLKSQYPDLVFTTSSGKTYLPSYAQAECKRISNIINKKEAALAQKENRDPELVHIYPHIFRHTFITKCVQSGMNPAAIQKIVGHAHLDMVEHYTHVQDSFISDEIQKLVKNFGFTDLYQGK